MPKLLLVRHAQPEITPGVAARLWPLSEQGRQGARTLAEHIAANYQPAAVFASPEAKAHETGQIIAHHLSLPVETITDLREHSREHTPFIGAERWEQTLTAFFAQPTELIFGEESAAQALQRFDDALTSLLAAHPQGDLLIATHGTVMTLFAAHYNPQIDTLAFWRALKLPDLVVLDLPKFKLGER